MTARFREPVFLGEMADGEAGGGGEGRAHTPRVPHRTRIRRLTMDRRMRPEIRRRSVDRLEALAEDGEAAGGEQKVDEVLFAALEVEELDRGGG